MNGKLYFTIFITFILIVMSMGIVSAETIVVGPANGTDTYAVKYGSTVRFANTNSSVTLGSSNDSGIKANGNEIYVGGLGQFTATVGGKTYKFFSWNAHLKTGSSPTYKTKAQSFSSAEGTLFADTYLVIEEVADSKLCQITDCFFAKGGSYKGDTLIGKYLTNYYDKSRKNQSKQSNFEYSMEPNDDVIIIGGDVIEPEPNNPEPSNPEPSNPEPSNPEPNNPEPNNPEPNNPEPEQTKIEIDIPSLIQITEGEGKTLTITIKGYNKEPKLNYDGKIVNIELENSFSSNGIFKYQYEVIGFESKKETVLTVTAGDVTATCTVKIVNKKRVEIEPEKLRLILGRETILKVKCSGFESIQDLNVAVENPTLLGIELQPGSALR